MTLPPTTGCSWYPRPEDWSSWQPLSASPGVPRRPGVYRIRCREGGRTQLIPRASGVDGTGLVLVGRDDASLRDCLDAFRRSAADLSVQQHAAGWAYANRGYERRFPLSELEVSYLITPDGATARAIEEAVLRVYQDQFLDLPPLNQAVPTATTAEPVRTEPSSRGRENRAGAGAPQPGGLPVWSPPSGRQAAEAPPSSSSPEHSQPARTESAGPPPWSPSAPPRPARPVHRRPALDGDEAEEPFQPLVEEDWKEYVVCARCGRVMGGPPDRPRTGDWLDWAGSDLDAQCGECGTTGEAYLFHGHELIEALRAAGYPNPDENPGLPPWESHEGFGRWTVPPVIRRILLGSRQ